LEVTDATDLQITGEGFGENVDPTDVTVEIGDSGQQCEVTAASDTSLTCSLGRLPVGDHAFTVVMLPKGAAKSSVSHITSPAIISSLQPSEGSVHGGLLLTIVGNGFVFGETSVDIGTAPCDTSLTCSPCEIVTVTLAEVTCMTPPHAEGDVEVQVTSGEVLYPVVGFGYTDGATPFVVSVDPSSGKPSDTVNITGYNFGAVNTVAFDGADCVVISQSTTEITCTAGGHEAGSTYVVVTAVGQGDSNSDQTFLYSLGLVSISPGAGKYWDIQAAKTFN
jgi:hypothetical protein